MAYYRRGYSGYGSRSHRQEYSLICETTDGTWPIMKTSYYKSELISEGEEWEEEYKGANDEHWTGEWDVIQTHG